MTKLPLSIAIAAAFATVAFAQPADAPRRTQAADAILLTVFLHHDQSKTLDEINKLEDEQGLYKVFPPPGTAVVSWHVVMGIGQIVTLEVPASKLREVNRSLEKAAWKNSLSGKGSSPPALGGKSFAAGGASGGVSPPGS